MSDTYVNKKKQFNKNLTNSQITIRSKVFNNKTLWDDIWREKKR